MSNSSLDVQIGGQHYKDQKIQPVEYIHANQIGFMEGSAIKYLSRHKRKGGRQDVEKALHFCQLILDLEYPIIKDDEEASSFTDPSVILDGYDMNQDLHQLIGYMVSLGWTNKVFPSSHCADVALFFLQKHDSVKPLTEAKKLAIRIVDAALELGEVTIEKLRQQADEADKEVIEYRKTKLDEADKGTRTESGHFFQD